MARRKYLLSSALAFAVAASSLFGQESQSTPAPTSPKPWAKRGGKNAAPNSPEFENVQRAIDALTPEQRRRFQENFALWVNLSPEDKRALRDRDELRRKRMRQEIDKTIRDSDLQLDSAQREQFAKRYAEERRKLEEQLRREMQEKRQPRLREIIGKLKEEFSQPQPATPAAATSLRE